MDTNRSFVPPLNICIRSLPPRLGHHTLLFSHLFTPHMVY
jgi:hypothetical protein